MVEASSRLIWRGSIIRAMGSSRPQNRTENERKLSKYKNEHRKYKFFKITKFKTQKGKVTYKSKNHITNYYHSIIHYEDLSKFVLMALIWVSSSVSETRIIGGNNSNIHDTATDKYYKVMAG